MSQQTSNTQILIIGGPNAGKTHFGGQLYGRLQMRSSHFKVVSPPEDLTVFKEVLEQLNDGKSAGHTNAAANVVLELALENAAGDRTLLSFPDYGGEQVNAIVGDRRVNKTWTEQLEKSTAWMLFIRLDGLVVMEDIVNRGIPAQDVLESRLKEGTPLSVSPASFYTELLQMLLYVKKTFAPDTVLPRLVIALSCWDLIEQQFQNKEPVEVLAGKLPFLLAFIKSNWADNDYAVVGLSSTGRTLSDDVPDMEFMKQGPENFGYLIKPNGEKEKDLTLAIKLLLGK